MDWPVKKSVASMAAVMIFSLIVMAIPGVYGAEIAIDMDSLSHTPENVTTDDHVTISVDMIFVGAEPAEDGVEIGRAHV